MFEISIKSTKDVRKLVVEFGDERVEVGGLSNQVPRIDDTLPTASPSSPKSLDDTLASRLAGLSNTTKGSGPTIATPVEEAPDISNREPLVDEEFSGQSY